MSDPRDEFIYRVVKGRSFAEVGGLWGTVNEKVSVARNGGATSLTMIDITPNDSALWKNFLDRMDEFDIANVNCLSADILEQAQVADHPAFDVVHCSGILYHAPDPIRFLVALRQITKEYLVLTSAVTSTKIESDEGALEIPNSAVLFLPALAERELSILKSYWQTHVGDGAIGITQPISRWQPQDFRPWWWLPTVGALKAMCMTAGLTFEQGSYHWNNNAYTLLLAV